MTDQATRTEREPGRMLVGGEGIDAAGGERLDILNPATGEVITTTPAGEETDVDAAVRAAKRAFDDGPWPRLTRMERAKLLNRFADHLEERMDALFRLETLNNGRPVRETRAQVGRLPEWFRYNAALLLAERTDVIPMPGPYLNYLLRHPIGVCGLLTPFNHPLMILAKSLAPALAAGNTVVIKPSELTPLTTLELGHIAAEAGIPDGVINIVTGLGASAGKALAEHPDVAKVTFTGGTDVGRSIGVAAAQRFARATTELGGKTPGARVRGRGRRARDQGRRLRRLHRRRADVHLRRADPRPGGASTTRSWPGWPRSRRGRSASATRPTRRPRWARSSPRSSARV